MDRNTAVFTEENAPSITDFFPLDFLSIVQYNKSQLDNANYFWPTCSFTQSIQQKEVQIEKIPISSADS